MCVQAIVNFLKYTRAANSLLFIHHYPLPPSLSLFTAGTKTSRPLLCLPGSWCWCWCWCLHGLPSFFPPSVFMFSSALLPRVCVCVHVTCKHSCEMVITFFSLPYFLLWLPTWFYMFLLITLIFFGDGNFTLVFTVVRILLDAWFCLPSCSIHSHPPPLPPLGLSCLLFPLSVH